MEDFRCNKVPMENVLFTKAVLMVSGGFASSCSSDLHFSTTTSLNKQRAFALVARTGLRKFKACNQKKEEFKFAKKKEEVEI